MENKIASYFKILSYTSLLVGATNADAASFQERVYHLSCRKSIHGIRIIDLRVNITAGSVERVRGVPDGWRVVVDNDPSGQASIRGGTSIGAATLTCNDLSLLSFTIASKPSFGLSFAVNDLVTTTKDFVSLKSYSLPMLSHIARQAKPTP